MQVLTETFLAQIYQVHVDDVEKQTEKKQERVNNKTVFFKLRKKNVFWGGIWECVC